MYIQIYHKPGFIIVKRTNGSSSGLHRLDTDGIRRRPQQRGEAIEGLQLGTDAAMEGLNLQRLHQEIIY